MRHTRAVSRLYRASALRAITRQPAGFDRAMVAHWLDVAAYKRRLAPLLPECRVEARLALERARSIRTSPAETLFVGWAS